MAGGAVARGAAGAAGAAGAGAAADFAAPDLRLRFFASSGAAARRLAAVDDAALGVRGKFCRGANETAVTQSVRRQHATRCIAPGEAACDRKDQIADQLDGNTAGLLKSS